MRHAAMRPLERRVCAQHGRELMGWKSPVGVPTWTHRVAKDNHEPTARARPRGLVRRKPECKRCEAEPGHKQSGGLFVPGEGPGHWPGAACKARTANRIVKAEGCCWRWHMTAKPTGTQPTVNAALVHRQFAHLPPGDLRRERRASDDDRPGTVHPGYQEPGAAASCPPRAKKPAAIVITARSAAGGNAGRDGAEVSRSRSRSPGVGRLKG